jgi:hypothetical protein
MASYNQKKKKKEKRNQIIMGVFLSLIMIASMLGIMLNQDQSITKYNDFKFEDVGNGFVSKINGQTLNFNYLPQEVEQFYIDPTFCSNLQSSSAIGFLFEPESESLTYTDFIRSDLQNTIAQPLISFITEESMKYSVYEVSSCNESTSILPIIFLKEGVNTSISVDGNCLIAESRQMGFLMLKDRLMYCYTGVIQ